MPVSAPPSVDLSPQFSATGLADIGFDDDPSRATKASVAEFDSEGLADVGFGDVTTTVEPKFETSGLADIGFDDGKKKQVRRGLMDSLSGIVDRVRNWRKPAPKAEAIPPKVFPLSGSDKVFEKVLKTVEKFEPLIAMGAGAVGRLILSKGLGMDLSTANYLMTGVGTLGVLARLSLPALEAATDFETKHPRAAKLCRRLATDAVMLSLGYGLEAAGEAAVDRFMPHEQAEPPPVSQNQLPVGGEPPERVITDPTQLPADKLVQPGTAEPGAGIVIHVDPVEIPPDVPDIPSLKQAATQLPGNVTVQTGSNLYEASLNLSKGLLTDPAINLPVGSGAHQIVADALKDSALIHGGAIDKAEVSRAIIITVDKVDAILKGGLRPGMDADTLLKQLYESGQLKVQLTSDSLLKLREIGSALK